MNITESINEKTALLDQKFIEIRASTKDVLSRFKQSAEAGKHKISSEAKTALEPFLTNQFWRKGNEEEGI